VIHNNSKVPCPVCNESISVFKEDNILRHYEMKRAEYYRTFAAKLFSNKLQSMKRVLSSQQHVSRRKTT
jgi:hypothetical protein